MLILRASDHNIDAGRCDCVIDRCTGQSACSDAGAANRWQSRLTGVYNSCTDITGVQPADNWPAQLAVNVSNNKG